MPNNNCLDGIWCSECGSEEPFSIYARAQFVVYDEGTDEFTNVEWDDESVCVCLKCKNTGVVKNFKRDQKEIDFKEKTHDPDRTVREDRGDAD